MPNSLLRLAPAAGLCAALAIGCSQLMMATPNLYLQSDANPWADLSPELCRTQVDVVYATDRAPEGEGDALQYGYGRSRSLAFGECTVQLGDERLGWDELVAESRVRQRSRAIPVSLQQIRELGRYPDTPWDFVVVGDRPQPAPGIVEAELAAARRLQEIVAARLAQTPRKEAYVYVHGFNNTFHHAAFVAAELWHFGGRQGVPIIYTWPAGSGASLVGYARDRESGEFTVFHLKQFLTALVETPGLERVHLVAHSRGCDVIASALRELAIKLRAAHPDEPDAARRLKICNLVLAAPDMDLEVARQRIEAERFGRVCERLTIYTSPDDLAIEFATWLFASTVRLGTLGLAKLPEDDRLTLAALPGIHVIDARVSTDLVGHSYFYSNPAVSSDLILLLRDNRPPGAEHGRPLRQQQGSFWELRDGYPNP